MGRWEPDGRGRLARAAMELYAERGFEQTTAGDIAGRAGLTERTFFRHFADKREVLFGGADQLQELLVTTLGGVPASTPPLDAVAAALSAAAATFFQDNHEFASRRQAVIAASAELRERELIKLAALATALAGTLRRRGVEEPAASLAAEAGVAVFRVAFERWVTGPADRTLAAHIGEALAELRSVTAAGPDGDEGP